MSERTAKTVKRSKSSEAEGARLDSEANRNRVVGSIFLISLAVIVLPMIFDGDGLARPDLPPMSADFEAPAEREITPPPPIPEIVEEQIAKLDEEVDEEGFDRSNGTLVGEPVLSEPNAQSDVYAVQVASFAAQENALKFRNQLREEGFEAFLSTRRAGETVMYRVAVGPLLDIEIAEQLRGEIAQQFQTQARVMAFSS